MSLSRVDELREYDDGVVKELGPYVLLEQVGAGGMGHVFRALHRPLGRVVALKLMRADRSLPIDRKRFVNEMKVVAGLSHPGLVQIFDGGSIDGHDYFAMELLSGESLERVLRRRGALPWQTATALCAALCDGLAFLHRHDVLHRDIKPSNVMIDADGRVKLLDFGLARGLDATHITAPDALVGTFGFIAPALLCGEEPSVASDLWSVGAVLHLLTAGRLPVPIGDISTWLVRASQEPIPPLHGSIPDVPVGLSRLAQDLLKPGVPVLVASAAELMERLDRVLMDCANTTHDSVLQAAAPVLLGSTAGSLLGPASGPAPQGVAPAHAESTRMFPRRQPAAAARARPPRVATVAALPAGGAPSRVRPGIACAVLVALGSIGLVVTRPVAPARRLETPSPGGGEASVVPDAELRRAFAASLLSTARPLSPLVKRIFELRAERARLPGLARTLARGHFERRCRGDLDRFLAAAPEWLADPTLDRLERRDVWEMLGHLAELDGVGEVLASAPVLDVAAICSRAAPLRRDAPVPTRAHRPLLALSHPTVKKLAMPGMIPVMTHRLVTDMSVIGFFHEDYIDAIEAFTRPSAEDPYHRQSLTLGVGRLPAGAIRDRPVRVTIAVANLAPEFCLWVHAGAAPAVWFRNRSADFRGFLSPGIRHTREALEAKITRMSIDLPAGYLQPDDLEVGLRLECMSRRSGEPEAAPQMGWLTELAFEELVLAGPSGR